MMSANADKLARNAKVHDLHREMKTSVSELVGVTNEIRRGIDPLTVGREMLAARDRQARSLGGGVGGDDAAGIERGARAARASNEARDADRRRRNGETARRVARDASRLSVGPDGRASQTRAPRLERLEEHMPFSAVSLGRLRNGGSGDDVFGGRVLADALEERAVAADALRLARSGALDRSVAERAEALRDEGAEVVRDG